MAPDNIKGTIRLIAWHHTSLAVDDLAAASAFFASAFGFRMEFKETGMASQIAGITGLPGLTCDLAQLAHPVTGQRLELIAFHPPRGVPVADKRPLRPGAAHIAFVVADLATARMAVEAEGAMLLGDIVPFDEGPALYCRIPGGAFLELKEKTLL